MKRSTALFATGLSMLTGGLAVAGPLDEIPTAVAGVATAGALAPLVAIQGPVTFIGGSVSAIVGFGLIVSSFYVKD